jgi:hypothetical protein
MRRHDQNRSALRGFPAQGRHFSKRACKPNSVVCGHSSRRRVAADTHQRPTRRFRHLLEPPVAYRTGTPRRPVLQALASPSLFGLAPCGVYPARRLTAPAVRSYRTFSPLPPRAGSKLPTGCCALLREPRWPRRFVFCGTGRPRALKPASRTLSGTLPCGVRTFLPRLRLTTQPAATAQLVCSFHSTVDLAALPPPTEKAGSDANPAKC